MTKALVSLSVKDFKSFKSKYDELKPKEFPVHELAVAESSSKQGDVYLIYQVNSMDVYHDMTNDSHMRELIQKAMDESGVISINDITFFN